MHNLIFFFIFQTDNGSLQNNIECKVQDPTDKILQDDSDKIAAAWAVELRKMDPQQQLFAKKAINEILFEGQMGTLHRNSIKINITDVF